MDQTAIGKRIAAWRKAKGWTQAGLGERLNVSDKAVSRWERGENAPDLSLIPPLADLFGVTTDELLRGTPGAPPAQDPDTGERSVPCPPSASAVSEESLRPESPAEVPSDGILTETPLPRPAVPSPDAAALAGQLRRGAVLSAVLGGAGSAAALLLGLAGGRYKAGFAVGCGFLLIAGVLLTLLIGRALPLLRDEARQTIPHSVDDPPTDRLSLSFRWIFRCFSLLLLLFAGILPFFLMDEPQDGLVRGGTSLRDYLSFFFPLAAGAAVLSYYGKIALHWIFCRKYAPAEGVSERNADTPSPKDDAAAAYHPAAEAGTHEESGALPERIGKFDQLWQQLRRQLRRVPRAVWVSLLLAAVLLLHLELMRLPADRFVSGREFRDPETFIAALEEGNTDADRTGTLETLVWTDGDGTPHSLEYDPHSSAFAACTFSGKGESFLVRAYTARDLEVGGLRQTALHWALCALYPALILADLVRQGSRRRNAASHRP